MKDGEGETVEEPAREGKWAQRLKEKEKQLSIDSNMWTSTAS